MGWLGLGRAEQEQDSRKPDPFSLLFWGPNLSDGSICKANKYIFMWEMPAPAPSSPSYFRSFETVIARIAVPCRRAARFEALPQYDLLEYGIILATATETETELTALGILFAVLGPSKRRPGWLAISYELSEVCRCRWGLVPI